MKKFVTLLLAGMMALSMAACGAPAENNDTKATDEAVATVEASEKASEKASEEASEEASEKESEEASEEASEAADAE